MASVPVVILVPGVSAVTNVPRVVARIPIGTVIGHRNRARRCHSGWCHETLLLIADPPESGISKQPYTPGGYSIHLTSGPPPARNKSIGAFPRGLAGGRSTPAARKRRRDGGSKADPLLPRLPGNSQLAAYATYLGLNRVQVPGTPLSSTS